MCFETTKSARAKTAKTDIECWKVVNRNLTNAFSKHLNSIYGAIPVQYEPRKVMPKVELKKTGNTFMSWWTTGVVINRGYHSFIQKPSLMEMREWKVDSSKIIVRKFIIPAGTRYYKNKTEYVSESIMLVK